MLGEPHNAKCKKRLSTHGIYITQRICCSNLTESVGIVHNRGKEVHRLHNGMGVIYPIDCAVVSCAKPHQYVGIFQDWQALKNFGQILRPDFAGSTSLTHKAGKLRLAGRTFWK